jgi:DNA-binding SARP family transcriptional activator
MRADPTDVRPRLGFASRISIPQDSALQGQGPADQWPHRVPRIRIVVLGRFCVLRAGVPLTCRKRPATKPLALLTALVLAGGKNVPLCDVAQQLSPEAQPGSAHARMRTTLRRVQSLLGTDEAIQVAGDRISLNPRVVSVDAFELLARCRNPVLPEPGADSVEGLLAAYPGTLLPDEDGDPRVARARERFAAAFAAAVLQLGQRAERAGATEQARNLYRTALAREPTAIAIGAQLAKLDPGTVDTLAAA